jgi:hypothetical protein
VLTGSTGARCAGSLQVIDPWICGSYLNKMKGSVYSNLGHSSVNEGSRRDGGDWCIASVGTTEGLLELSLELAQLVIHDVVLTFGTDAEWGMWSGSSRVATLSEEGSRW